MMLSFDYRKYLQTIKGWSLEKNFSSSTPATSRRGSTRLTVTACLRAWTSFGELAKFLDLIVSLALTAFLDYCDAMTRIGIGLKKIGLLVGVIGAASVSRVRADCPDYSDYSLVSQFPCLCVAC